VVVLAKPRASRAIAIVAPGERAHADAAVPATGPPQPKLLSTPWAFWIKDPAIKDWVKCLTVNGTANTDAEL
jgi:hypothetical protein